MPNDILEQHPYLNDIDYGKYGENYFEGLIIGTFPVWDITDTIEPNGQINEHPFNHNTAYMRFFYGSKRNVFWELLSNTFAPALNPVNNATPQLRKHASIDLLINKKLLITDVFYKTNRRDKKAEDQHLWIDTENQFVLNNRSLNNEIANLLYDNKSIKYLYFTATDNNGKCPFGKFREIFNGRHEFEIISEVKGRVWSAVITIDERKYTGFFLPSPAGKGTRGIHYGPKQQLQMFINYITTVSPALWQQIQGINPQNLTINQNKQISLMRKKFLDKCWHEAFLNHNINFNGAI